MYQYQQLSKGDDYIRRLILEPGKGEAPIVTRLEQIQLSRAHDLYPFKTISYVWGSSNKDQVISVDGKPLEITKSLRNCLWQTRDPYEPVALWADAICINQNDEKEKGQQVALMGQIYARSQQTLICLGLDVEDQESARDLAGIVGEVEVMIDEVFQDPNFSWDWDSFPYPFDDEPIISDERWHSLGELAAQPWFERGWVVQEAALSPNVIMLWAGQEIRFRSLIRVQMFLNMRVHPMNPDFSFTVTTDLFSDIYNNQYPKEARTFWTEESQDQFEPMASIQILHQARQLSLTDSRDRIYAFMALETSDKTMATIHPDYGKDVSHLDVYRDFAIKYIERTSDLDILRFVVHKEEENSSCSSAAANARIQPLPSWVPRWDLGGSGSHEMPFVTHRDRKIAFIDSKDVNSSDFTISNVEGRPVLRVKAILLDSVKYISEILKNYYDVGSAEGQKAVTQVVSLWQNLAPHLKKYPGPHRGNPSLALLVALNHGYYMGDWDDYYKDLHEFARRLQSDQPTACVKDSVIQRIALSFCDQSSHRRFVLLGRGYFGTAPQLTREGDVCAIISGTRAPFVLRKVPGKQDQYSVLGPVFILSKRNHISNGTPLRLAEDKFCDDWKDWGLRTEYINLV